MDPGHRRTPPLPPNFVTLRHLQEEHQKKKLQEEEQRKKKLQEEEHQKKTLQEEEEEKERRKQQAVAEDELRAAQQRQLKELPPQRRKPKSKPRRYSPGHKSTGGCSAATNDQPDAPITTVDRPTAHIITVDRSRLPRNRVPLSKKKAEFGASGTEQEAREKAESVPLEAKKDPIRRAKMEDMPKAKAKTETLTPKPKKKNRTKGKAKREEEDGKNVAVPEGRAEVEALTLDLRKDLVVGTERGYGKPEVGSSGGAVRDRWGDGWKHSVDRRRSQHPAAWQGMVWVRKTEGASGM